MRDAIIRKTMPFSPSLNKCSREAHAWWPHLLFARDNHGRFNADPRAVRVAIAPMRDDMTDAEVAGWLDEWEKVGQIRRWKVGDHVYGELVNYDCHNDDRFRRRPSSYAKPEEINSAIDEEKEASQRLPVDVLQALENAYPGRLKVDHTRKVFGWLHGSQQYTSREVLDALEAAKHKADPLSYAATILRSNRDKAKLQKADVVVPTVNQLENLPAWGE